MAGIGLDWMGNPAAPPPAAAESEEGEPAEEVEPSPSAPPTNAQNAEEHEERPAEETSSETAADPRSPVPVSIAPGDVREPDVDAEPAGEKRDDGGHDDDDDDDGIDEVEFVRVPLASAQRLKILDRGPKEELERMHAEDRGGMLTEIRVCKALLRQAYPLMSSDELDETLRKHVAKQRAKADPSIDVLRVPLPSITNEAMDDGMARTLLVSARERLLERERLFEDATERAEAKMDDAAAKMATLDRLREEADARAAAARDEVSALRARLERADETAAIASSGAVSSSPFASKTKTSGAASGSRLPSVALVVNVFDGAEPSEDLREAARAAQTDLIALKLERDAANALAKETGELASSSADRIDELNGRVRDLTKDLADAREEAESWRRVANSAKTAGAQRAEAASRDASDRERRLQQKAAALENDLRVANSKTQRLERSLATTKELADKAAAEQRSRLDAAVDALNADLASARAERDAAVESLRVKLLDAKERASDAELRAREAEAASDALRFEMEETLESSYDSPTKKAATLELERMKKRLAEAEARVRELTEEASERERETSATAADVGDVEDVGDVGDGGDDSFVDVDRPTSAFDESSPDETSIARVVAERDAYRRRAESAEKKAEAARLLMAPVPMTDELREMREAAKKGAEAEAKTAGLEAALRDAVDSARDARVAAHDSSEALRRERSEFDLWRERARGLMEEKDRELDALRRRVFGGDGHRDDDAPSLATTSSETNGATAVSSGHRAMSAEDFEHFKGAMLRFLLAEDYATQQAMMPVLAALLRFHGDEAAKVSAAREKWEPVDVAIGKQLPESFEQAANSLTDTLGLGKLF